MGAGPSKIQNAAFYAPYFIFKNIRKMGSNRGMEKAQAKMRFGLLIK